MKSIVKAKKLGYIVKYVPHKIIADHNATYNVEYKGQHIATGASEKLKIPLKPAS